MHEAVLQGNFVKEVFSDIVVLDFKKSDLASVRHSFASNIGDGKRLACGEAQIGRIFCGVSAKTAHASVDEIACDADVFDVLQVA